MSADDKPVSVIVAPGPLNCICDVPGIRVGNAEDMRMLTGTTVVLPDRPVVAAVDHRGGGIGSRDTVLLGSGSIVERVHAICLSGGSAFGLDAAGGVMDVLRQQGRGFKVGDAIVPIVPSAIIFDLNFGPERDWKEPPWWSLGQRATSSASDTVPLGNVGAGLGATAGPLKGGLGTASYRTERYTIGALAVANPAGEVVAPGSSSFFGWSLEQADELGGQTPITAPTDPATLPRRPGALQNTTLVVVATDAPLTRDAATRVAIMAQDGLARAIRPVHTPMDGDTVFVLSTTAEDRAEPPLDTLMLGQLAADVAARAIMRGVYEAEPLAGVPSYRSVYGA